MKDKQTKALEKLLKEKKISNVEYDDNSLFLLFEDGSYATVSVSWDNELYCLVFNKDIK